MSYKNLWTPWRMEHILGQAKKVTGCLFEPDCSEPQSKEHLLLYQDDLVTVILNRFPYANGHLLISPRRHVAELSDLSKQEKLALMEMTSTATEILKRHLSADGFNIGLNLGKVAGAGMADHLHFHVVPRWQDDHNFITVIADIRAIPQHIEETWEILAPDFKNISLTP